MKTPIFHSTWISWYFLRYVCTSNKAEQPKAETYNQKTAPPLFRTFIIARTNSYEIDIHSTRCSWMHIVKKSIYPDINKKTTTIFHVNLDLRLGHANATKTQHWWRTRRPTRGCFISPFNHICFFLPFIIEWPQSDVATSAIWRHNFTTQSFDFGV